MGRQDVRPGVSARLATGRVSVDRLRCDGSLAANGMREEEPAGVEWHRDGPTVRAVAVEVSDLAKAAALEVIDDILSPRGVVPARLGAERQVATRVVVACGVVDNPDVGRRRADVEAEVLLAIIAPSRHGRDALRAC